MRRPYALIATALSALLLAACGSEGVSVSSDDASGGEGAELFATHCSGCHTIGAAGTQGSGNRATRTQGPNFDQRVESYDDALFAIHNGGFSGAIMPQNIVVGEDAEKVAQFLADYSGTDVEVAVQPSPGGSGEQTTEPAAGGEQQGAGGSGSAGEQQSSGSG